MRYVSVICVYQSILVPKTGKVLGTHVRQKSFRFKHIANSKVYYNIGIFYRPMKKKKIYKNILFARASVKIQARPRPQGIFFSNIGTTATYSAM